MNPPPVDGPQHSCSACGGEMIDGRVAMPIVGSLRFVFRLGTNEITTEILARMCGDCGHVELRGRDPGLIGRARRAAAEARPLQRWALRMPRPPARGGSRDGQEQAQ